MAVNPRSVARARASTLPPPAPRVARSGRVGVGLEAGLWCVLVVVGPTAVEGARPRVAVVPVEVGTAPPGTDLEMRRRLEAGLERARLEVVDASAAWTEHGDAACDAACMKAIATATKSQRIVRTKIDVDDTVWNIAIDLVDGRTGEVEASVADTCEICGAQEVGELVTARAAGLAERTRAIVSVPPVLSVRADPEDALVLVDGRVVGRAPLRHRLAEGRHVVRVEQPGYTAQERVVMSQAGVHESIAVELTPQPELASDRRKRRLAFGLGGASVAAGVLAIGTGIPLIAIDGRDYRRDCNGDADGDCQFRYETLTGGAIATAVGIALVAAGATVIGITRARMQSRPGRARMRLDGFAWRF